MANGHSLTRLLRRVLNYRRRVRPASRKMVLVGDTAVGKTALLNIQTAGAFPEEHAPTLFDNYVQETWVDGHPFRLSLVDTAGAASMHAVRALSYADTHVAILCFSVIRPDSLTGALTRWSAELAEFCPGVAIILVATQCDLREDPFTLRRMRALHQQQPISYEEGCRAAERLGAVRYLECSAMHDIGVSEVFEQAVRVARDARPHGANLAREQQRRERKERAASTRPLTRSFSRLSSMMVPRSDMLRRRVTIVH